jgi:hypothetical protein
MTNGERDKHPGQGRPSSLARAAFEKLPLLISCLALGLSFLGYRLTAVRNVKPALVFAFSLDAGWTLRNIGNGPAMDPVVAQRQDGGEWTYPVRVPPLEAGAMVSLHWLKYSNVRWLGVTYADIDGRAYLSTSVNDRTTISRGNQFPSWQGDSICRSWELDTAAHRRTGRCSP